MSFKAPTLGDGSASKILQFSKLRAERPMAIGRIWSPEVQPDLNDGRVVYDRRRRRARPQQPPTLVMQFADLASADGATILRFARRWGSLGIGDDGWKKKGDYESALEELFLLGSSDARAHADTWRKVSKALPEGVRTGQIDPNVDSESIEGWRMIARRFRAALNIGAALSSAKRYGTEDDWRALGQTEGHYIRSVLMQDHYFACRELQEFIQTMVIQFRVAPRFWWHEEKRQWHIDFDAYGISNLVGALLIQLMLIVANKDGFAICSACNRSFVPYRMPDRRRTYCDDCRNHGAPLRDAQRDHRARQKNKTTTTRRQKPGLSIQGAPR